MEKKDREREMQTVINIEGIKMCHEGEDILGIVKQVNKWLYQALSLTFHARNVSRYSNAAHCPAIPRNKGNVSCTLDLLPAGPIQAYLTVPLYILDNPPG